MISICGRNAHVTLEFPDGTALAGSVIATQVRLDSNWYGGPSTWEVELTGIGDLSTTEAVRHEIVEAKARDEWRCPYCGRIHPFEHYDCKDGCGAPRPILYGER
jgi:hypothetical protein